MSSPLVLLTQETILLLRRDKVTFPAMIAGILVSAVANLASGWSVEDFTKVLYDIGYFGFQLTGSLVAIFWGAKVLSDSRQEGAVEVQLAAPITRSTWILAKYLGLATCLGLIGALFLVIWQGLMVINDFGPMSLRQITLFGLMLLGWMVLASLSLMMASATRQATAIFSSLALWICGTASSVVASTLNSDTPEFTRSLVNLIYRLWDLQAFSFIDEVITKEPMAPWPILIRFAYGLCLIGVFLTASCIIFKRRDLVPEA